MSKRYAEYVHVANWAIPSDYPQPVVVLVTFWEPEMTAQTFIYHDAQSALKALSSPEWNQQFMSELDDEWEIHDDVVIHVMAF
jgi:hypothetical protein